MGKNKVCCFTGHRVISEQDSAELPERVFARLVELYSNGVREFRAGGAVGFDTVAAMATIKLKEQHPDVILRLMLPCRDQCSYWSPETIWQYKEVLGAADRVDYINNFYTKNCMILRNIAMLEDADYCLCYYNGTSKGGTAFTVKRAKEQEVEVINLLESAVNIAEESGEE